ncbi:hypothetical protein Lal_00005889 [Lupinus albus]|nr:hypothetical protein Lal_00005889 [Lupinus albus]
MCVNLRMRVVLGVKDIHSFNIVMLGKSNRRLINESDSLWCKVLKFKYGHGFKKFFRTKLIIWRSKSTNQILGSEDMKNQSSTPLDPLTKLLLIMMPNQLFSIIIETFCGDPKLL